MDNFISFLTDWLKTHILVSDLAYLAAVKSHLNRL
jgi:hemerythrin